MLSFVFAVLCMVVFGRLMGAAFRLTRGVTKIFFNLIFLPIVLIILVADGLMYLALPLALVIGLISLVSVPVSR